MWNRNQILDKIHRSLGIIIALIALLGFALKATWIPKCVFFIILSHSIGILLYLLFPWDSWEWPSKDEVVKSTFHRWSKWLHTLIVIALFISPLVCIGVAFSAGFLPTYLDATFQQSFVKQNGTSAPSIQYLQASLVVSNTAELTNSYVGSASGQTVILIPTQNLVKCIIEPLPSTFVSNGALPIAALIGVASILLILFEKFVRVMQEKR